MKPWMSPARVSMNMASFLLNLPTPSLIAESFSSHFFGVLEPLMTFTTSSIAEITGSASGNVKSTNPRHFWHSKMHCRTSSLYFRSAGSTLSGVKSSLYRFRNVVVMTTKLSRGAKRRELVVKAVRYFTLHTLGFLLLRTHLSLLNVSGTFVTPFMISKPLLAPSNETRQYSGSCMPKMSTALLSVAYASS